MDTRSELTQACHDRFQEAKDRYSKDAGEIKLIRLLQNVNGYINEKIFWRKLTE